MAAQREVIALILYLMDPRLIQAAVFHSDLMIQEFFPLSAGTRLADQTAAS
jgi:hypothetical protein